MNRQPVRTVLAGVAAAVLLAGCASQQLASNGTAGQLQERVRTVRQLVTEQNHSGALAELDGLSADVAAAADRGDLSAEQQQRADQALSAVRADLESMVAETAPAEAPAADSPAPSSGAGSGDDSQEPDEDCDDDDEDCGQSGWQDQESWHGHDSHGDWHDSGDSGDSEDDD